jgi:L-lactate permease
VNPGRTWLVYTLIRVGVFAVVLALLLLLQLEPWIAAVIAAIISLCISIIFLRKPREAASRTLFEARQNRGQASRQTGPVRSEDEDVEDDAVDGTSRADGTGRAAQ